MRTPDPRRVVRGGASRDAGRAAEVIAAVWLMAKGYQILGFRLRLPQGEIDLLAKRGRTLAVVEVKARPTLNDCIDAVTPRQRERLRRAAAALTRGRGRLAALHTRLDLFALSPGARPRHIPDAWRGT